MLTSEEGAVEGTAGGELGAQLRRDGSSRELQGALLATGGLLRTCCLTGGAAHLCTAGSSIIPAKLCLGSARSM